MHFSLEVLQCFNYVIPVNRVYNSENIDSEKIKSVISNWKRASVKGSVFVIMPEAEKNRVTEIQEIASAAGMPLTGAVFPELVINSKFSKTGIIIFSFEEAPEYKIVQLQESSPDELNKYLATLKDAVKGKENSTLFMIFDAMVPQIATILDDLYLQLADRVHYMGVNAGSETFQPMNCLFDNTRFIQGGVLFLLLHNHKGAILDHGYQAPAKLISATATKGNKIISIDWKPAFEVYQALVKTSTGLDINKENFYQNGVHYPFGIIRANNEVLVRIPVALQEDGSIFCVGEVPTNSVLTLLHAPQIDQTQTIKTLSQGIKSITGSTENSNLLVFYCAGRRLHLGQKSETELHDLLSLTSGENILGGLSLGEIGSSIEGGYPVFHNGAIICSSLELK